MNSVDNATAPTKHVKLPIKLAPDVAYRAALLRLNPNNQVLALCYEINLNFLGEPFF